MKESKEVVEQANTTDRRITTLRHEYNALGKPVRLDVNSQAFGKQMNLK